MVVLTMFSGCTNFDLLVEECVASGRCGAGGVIDAGVPVLSGEPSALSFTLVSSEASTSQRLTIRNREGTADSLAFAFGGVNAADFRLANQCGTTLAAGQSCDLDVSFAPTVPAVGQREAVLEVRAATGSPLLIPLTGAVTQTLETVAALDFGDVATLTPMVLQLSVRNLSTKPVSVVPSVSAPFSIGVNQCSAVASMQTCLIDVRFDAPAAGEREATLLLALAGSAASQSVTLRARSVATGQLRIVPSTLFASPGVAVDRGQSIDLPIRLSNAGAQDIKSFDLRFSGASSWSLEFDAGCATIPVDAGCDGTLRFSPSAIGIYPMTLSVDAGPIGNAQLAGDGRGTGVSSLTMNVTTGGPGIWVNQSLDGGRCYGACTYELWTDPYDAGIVRFTAAQHPLLREAQWSSTSCDGSVCDVALDRDVIQLSVDLSPRQVAFVTNQQFTANHGGVTGADGLCNEAALSANLPGRFQAFIVNRDGGPSGRFTPGTVYATTDGGTWTLRTDAGVNLGTELGTAGGTTLVWTGLPVGASTCDDWSQACCGGGGASNTTLSPWTHQSYNCNNSARLLCLSTPWTPIPANAWVIVAAKTSGLAANFQGECDATKILGFKQVYPYVLTGTRPPCRSFELPDGGAGPTLSGPLYRANGEIVLSDAQELKNCTTTTAPPLQRSVYWAVEDGGLEPSATQVVRVGARWGSDTGTSSCSGFSTVSSGLSFGSGNLRRRDAAWFNLGTQNCSVASHIYCVGQR